MDPEAVVVRASKTKTLFLLVLAIGFVALGAWFLSVGTDGIEARRLYGDPIFVHGLGWVTVVFFGLGVVAAVWRVFSRKPGLVLGREGVTIFAIRQDTFLPWKGISGLSVFEVRRNKVLVLNLRDPERFIESVGKVRRALARTSLKLCGSPICDIVGHRSAQLRRIAGTFR